MLNVNCWIVFMKTVVQLQHSKTCILIYMVSMKLSKQRLPLLELALKISALKNKFGKTNLKRKRLIIIYLVHLLRQKHQHHRYWRRLLSRDYFIYQCLILRMFTIYGMWRNVTGPKYLSLGSKIMVFCSETTKPRNKKWKKWLNFATNMGVFRPVQLSMKVVL